MSVKYIFATTLGVWLALSAASFLAVLVAGYITPFAPDRTAFLTLGINVAAGVAFCYLASHLLAWRQRRRERVIEEYLED